MATAKKKTGGTALAGKGGVIHDGVFIPAGEPLPDDWPQDLVDELVAGGGAKIRKGNG